MILLNFPRSLPYSSYVTSNFASGRVYDKDTRTVLSLHYLQFLLQDRISYLFRDVTNFLTSPSD